MQEEQTREVVEPTATRPNGVYPAIKSINLLELFLEPCFGIRNKFGADRIAFQGFCNGGGISFLGEVWVVAL